jgi:hypothetical protein
MVYVFPQDAAAAMTADTAIMAALTENLFISLPLFIRKIQQKSLSVFAVLYIIWGNFNKK